MCIRFWRCCRYYVGHFGHDRGGVQMHCCSSVGLHGGILRGGILITLRAAHGDPDRIARAPGARSVVRIVRRRLSLISWGAPGARELC